VPATISRSTVDVFGAGDFASGAVRQGVTRLTTDLAPTAEGPRALLAMMTANEGWTGWANGVTDAATGLVTRGRVTLDTAAALDAGAGTAGHYGAALDLVAVRDVPASGRSWQGSAVDLVRLTDQAAGVLDSTTHHLTALGLDLAMGLDWAGTRVAYGRGVQDLELTGDGATRAVALQVSAEEDLIVTIDLATGRIRTSLRKRLVIIQ
jgi:hypothetical protein